VLTGLGSVDVENLAGLIVDEHISPYFELPDLGLSPHKYQLKGNQRMFKYFVNWSCPLQRA
jgi:hypothetical protein